ncbi:MAG: ATP-dependent RNA helicase [Spirochaetales bacterium]|nr:ATP-dependent RNA helicase [Spirochaetales bacterium]
MNPHELPIYQHKDIILQALAENQVIVVESPTGSGKTTQLPIILHEAGYASRGIIGITQPRRIATLSVSDFIARQLGTSVPGVVGYKMRFEDMTTPETAIKIMTDGILLQEMKLDPFLSRYGVIMVDEAHERSLNIDFILGLLKKILEARSDFRVIVSSATINAEVFSEYFSECPIVRIDAPMYPVRVVYDPLRPAPGTPDPAAAKVRGVQHPTGSDFGLRTDQKSGSEPGQSLATDAFFRSSDEALYDKIESIVGRVLDGEAGAEPGDILIFLPGEKTIKECLMRLMSSRWARRLHCIPLYARLGKDEQERVFEPAPEGKIKVVIATNIAETSVTIDGITVVIDSGLAKINFYNPKTFTASLIESPISRASCNQRRGRAGRTRPGICYRLYSLKDFESRPLYPTEEIHRTDLSEVLLRMAELGITDFEHFDFIARPPKAAIRGAIEVLTLLDALNADRTLTSVGEMMCAFPLLPKLSRMVVEAIRRYPDVISEVLIAAAFLSTTSPYVLPPGEETEARAAHHQFRDPLGDFVSYLRLYDAFNDARDKTRFCERNYLDERTLREIVRIKTQLELIVSDLGVPIGSGGPLSDYLCAVSRGLIQFVCARESRGLFRSLTAEKIQIHPGSVMFRENPDFIVAGEIVRTTRMYAMSVSPLTTEQLYRISPDLAEQLIAIRKGIQTEFPTLARGTRAEMIAARGLPEAAGQRRTEGRDKQSAAAPRLQRQDTLSLGGAIFPIEGKKRNKRMVVLEWNKLKPVLQAIGPADELLTSSIRARLEVGKYRLFEGEKLSTVLKVLQWIDPERQLGDAWPKGRTYALGDEEKALQELLELVTSLDLLLHPAKVGKTGRLGFLALCTDDAVNFWFRPSKSFAVAISLSLSSIELLIDHAQKLGASTHVREKIGSFYRKLSAYLAT